MQPIQQRSAFVLFLLSVSLFAVILLACEASSAQPTASVAPESDAAIIYPDLDPDGDGVLVLPDDAVTAISPTQSSPEQPSATPESTQTAFPPTETAFPALPTATPTCTPTNPRWVTRTPTITPTPIPPYAQLMIQEPGPLSKLVSPLYCEFGVFTAGDGMLYIDLLDEQGEPFIQKELYLYQGLSRRIYSSLELDFELDTVAIASRLVFSTRDVYDRLVALSSVDVILLQLGSDEVNPAASLYEPYFIQSPLSGNFIEGGAFVLKGLVRPVNSAAIIIDLVDEQNLVIDSTSMDAVDYLHGDAYSPFEITIDYTVQTTTRVRLLIWQGSDNRIPGIVAASSLALTLYP